MEESCIETGCSVNDGIIVPIPLGIDPEKYSSLIRLLRVIVRFIGKLKGKQKQNHHDCVTDTELKEAETMW